MARLMVSWVYGAMEVTVPDPYTVVLPLQPVTLRCRYETTATTSPIVTWTYKSPCPGTGTGTSTGTGTTCPDTDRTVRIVAAKQGSAVTVGPFYQGRPITIVNEADLQLGPAAWGDGGSYVCSVASVEDLLGSSEATAELVVLG
uniref:Ig-like domain-containing protein n=1 Tax=Nothoprocta perdicaria TaxID=30464 RepID=A0A8C6ZCD3_NOTPE